MLKNRKACAELLAVLFRNARYRREDVILKLPHGKKVRIEERSRGYAVYLDGSSTVEDTPATLDELVSTILDLGS